MNRVECERSHWHYYPCKYDNVIYERASIYNEGELRQQKPSFAPMYCARMDVKPTNRRRRSVDSAIALRFKAGRDFTWTR